MLAHLESEENDLTARDATRRKLYLAASAIQMNSSYVVEILNISETGLLLKTDQELSPNEPIVMVLPESEECVARIAWAGDNLYGCQFVNRLTKAELSAALLQAKPQPQPQRSEVDYLPNYDVQETLGQRLKRLREASPYSMIELAEMVGVTKPTLWKWETDKVRPREKAVQALARVFAIDEMTLLYGHRGSGAPLQRFASRHGRGNSRQLSQVIGEARRAIADHAGVDAAQVTVSIAWN